MGAVKQDKHTGEYLGTGRRKSAVARVRVRSGSGNLTINKRSLEEYFDTPQDRIDVAAPLEQSGRRAEVDVQISVSGGGNTGQSGACRMGIARALAAFDQELDTILRGGGFMTRDSRMKERKKPGLHGARRGTQFSKR